MGKCQISNMKCLEDQFVISQKRSIPGQKGDLFLHVMVASGAWNGSLANGVVCDPSSQLDISCGPEFFYGNFLESFSGRESFSDGRPWLRVPRWCRILFCCWSTIDSISHDKKSNSKFIHFSKIQISLLIDSSYVPSVTGVWCQWFGVRLRAFILFSGVLDLHCLAQRRLSLVVWNGGYSLLCSMGISCCRAQMLGMGASAVEHTGSGDVAQGLSLVTRGIFPD